MSAVPDRAANVVLDADGALLVVRRHKHGRRYCVLPGGGVEPAETPEDAAVRELREETGLFGRIEVKLWTLQHRDRVAHYYLTTTISTEPLGLNGPELASQSPGNCYAPGWISMSDLDAENLQPADIRCRLTALDSQVPGKPG